MVPTMSTWSCKPTSASAFSERKGLVLLRWPIMQLVSSVSCGSSCSIMGGSTTSESQRWFCTFSTKIWSSLLCSWPTASMPWDQDNLSGWAGRSPSIIWYSPYSLSWSEPSSKWTWRSSQTRRPFMNWVKALMKTRCFTPTIRKCTSSAKKINYSESSSSSRGSSWACARESSACFWPFTP